MGAVDLQLVHQLSDVRRLLSNAYRTGDVSAARVTDAMIGDQAVLAERRLLQQRLEPVGEDPGVHEHDRIARADQPVFQLDSFQRCTLPGLRKLCLLS
jgi:hypothetical protein